MVFTEPGLALVGRAPDPTRSDRTACVNYADQGRARVMGRNAGLLKIHANRDGVLVGADMAMPGAEHLAHPLAWAVQEVGRRRRCSTARSIIRPSRKACGEHWPSWPGRDVPVARRSLSSRRHLAARRLAGPTGLHTSLHLSHRLARGRARGADLRAGAAQVPVDQN